MSPALCKVLAALKLRAGGATYVFGGKRPMLRTLPEAARRRLVDTYGAPDFYWQTLRRTCGTYLTNAAGVFGAKLASMTQSEVSRFEKREDHKISSLREMVEALGGELEVVAVVGGTRVRVA